MDEPISRISIEIGASSDKAVSEIDKTADSLHRLKAAAGSGSTANGLKNIGTAAGTAAKKVNTLLSSLKRIAFYRAIRSVIKAISTFIKEGLENFYNFSQTTGEAFQGYAAAVDSVKAATETLKNQVGAAFGSLYQSVIPIISAIIDAVTKLANALTMIFSAFSGNGGWYKAKNGFNEIGKAAGGAGRAAKEALKYLAPFDEINRLPDDKTGGGGGGGGTGAGFEDLYEWVPFNENSILGKLSTFVHDNLEGIELFVDEFTFAVGAVLALSGANIPLGIGLMAIGAYKYYHDASQNWNAIKSQLRGPLGDVMTLLGTASFAVGALLAFSGTNIPLGIGLMIAGIGAVATVAAATVKWDAIEKAMRGPIGAATALASTAFLVLGFLMLFAQKWPLGLGLIAAGVAGLGITGTLNWSSIKQGMEGPIGTATAYVSGALLVLGVLSLLAQRWPLGVGLITAGAVGLVTSTGFNWNAIRNGIKDPIDNAVKYVSGASLLLGVLCLLAQRYALGIGLIALGATGLVATSNFNWNGISNTVKDPIAKAEALIGGAALLLGVVALLAGKPALGIGLIAAGTVATEMAIDNDAIKNVISDPVKSAVAVIEGASLLLGAILIATGNVPAGVALMASGAAGLATTVGTSMDWSNFERVGAEAREAFDHGFYAAEKYENGDAGWFWRTFAGVNYVPKIEIPVGFSTGDMNLDQLYWNLKRQWDDEGFDDFVIKIRAGHTEDVSEDMREAFKHMQRIATDGYYEVYLPIGLIQDNWDGNGSLGGSQTVNDFVKRRRGDSFREEVGLEPDGWSTVADWIKQTPQYGEAVDKSITLNSRIDSARDDNKKVSTFISDWNSLTNKYLTVTVNVAGMSILSTLLGMLGTVAGFFGSRLASSPLVRTPQYATGGFPEDGIFMANSGELVGKFANGRTAVANNDQIIAGIERGVYNAVTAAMSNQNDGGREVRVYLDGKQITNAVTRNQSNMSRATGVAYG